MIYIVGTGRCGTTTAAKILYGVHEPEPNIIREANDYYLGDSRTHESLFGKLKKRSNIKTRCISDHKQSTVIGPIIEVDPSAEFIVLARNPLESVSSFLNRGWYIKKGRFNTHRLRPRLGFPKNMSQIEKLSWLWMETYRVILDSLAGIEFDVVLTSQLGDIRHNQSNHSYKDLFSDEEKKTVDVFTGKTWGLLQKMSEQRKIFL